MKTTAVSILIMILLFCLGVTSEVHAVVPAPDGCYPNYTTAEGCNALGGLGTGAGNTGIGWYALFSDSTGNYNTSVGGGALALNNGDSNTAVGAAALLLNTTGSNNTANGVDALVFNNTGGENTATGAFALFSNTAGNFNTAAGFFALHDNTTGSGITGYGASALQHNTTGNFNTAVGGNALQGNTTGVDNTATGTNALFSNTIGADNTAIGASTLAANTGSDNTALGFNALSSNTTGLSNTAVGSQALSANTTGADNTAVGFGALANSTGNNNTALGLEAGDGVFNANNVICIGVSGEDVTGTTWIGGIFGRTTVSGTTLPVIVSDSGQLGTTSSSRRFKKEIKPMDQASESILALKPVTFHYKSDKTNTAQFGLVAEDVAQVNPDLVVRDKYGEIYSVRYDQVNAMLLNEFLKEHRTVQEQKATIAELRENFAQQQKRIEALSAGLQKVSAQLEVSKPAPQTVLNNQ